MLLLRTGVRRGAKKGHCPLRKNVCPPVFLTNVFVFEQNGSASDLKQCSLSKYAAARAIREQTRVTVIAVSPACLAARALMMTANSQFTRITHCISSCALIGLQLFSCYINALAYCVKFIKIKPIKKVHLHTKDCSTLFQGRCSDDLCYLFDFASSMILIRCEVLLTCTPTPTLNLPLTVFKYSVGSII